MIWSRCSTVRFFALLFGLSAPAMAMEWPSTFVVHSGTESPRGRYGILVPPHESESNEEANCYLADIQSHRVLGKLEGVDYFEDQNHAGLTAVWDADSMRCMVTRDGRFGFDTIALIEPNIHRLTEGGLRAGTAGLRFAHTPLGSGYAGPRPIPGHGPHHYKFHVLALDEPVPDTATTARGVLAAIDGHVIATGMLTGTYQR